MNPLALLSAAGRSRILLLEQLPTVAIASYILILIWSGAATHPPDMSTVAKTVHGLNVSTFLILVIALFIGSVALSPLLSWFAAMLEGYAIPHWLANRLMRRKLRRFYREQKTRHQLESQLYERDFAGIDDTAEESELRRGIDDAWRKLGDFPEDVRYVTPTRLGNLMRRVEITAGQLWGFDSVVMLPRLMQVLPERPAEIVNEQLAQVQLPMRLCAASLIGIVFSVPLLYRWGWWNLLLIALLLLALMFYYASLGAARQLEPVLSAAFDMHHGLILAALGAPEDLRPERRLEVLRDFSHAIMSGDPEELERILASAAKPLSNPGQNRKNASLWTKAR